jgi:hypothetical protein
MSKNYTELALEVIAKIAAEADAAYHEAIKHELEETDD